MAEKKKTTTAKKKVAPKKATTKAKSSTKAKSTVKKTTAKKTVAKKAPAKKVTTTKKKAAPRVMDSAPKSVLSFADWKSIVGDTFKAFKATWWRMGVISLISFVLIALTAGGSFFGLLSVAGGMQALESQFVNLQLGTPDLTLLWIAGLMLIAFITLVFLISFVTNIAVLLTFKNYRKKKANNPLRVFFQETWAFLGRYTWMSVRVFWYIIWPMLLPLLMLIALGMMFTVSGYENDGLMAVVAILAGLLAFGLLIWRAVLVSFAYAGLIEADKPTKTVLDKAISLVHKNWWLTVWAFFLFFVPLILIQVLLDANGTQMSETGALLPSTPLQNVFDIISMIFTIFIFTPLSISFIYLTMLHLSKTKKIKL